MGFFNWHKNYLTKFQNRTKMSYYQIVWLAWFKGIIMGLAVYHFLLM